jgi:hypothetical protein
MKACNVLWLFLIFHFLEVDVFTGLNFIRIHVFCVSVRSLCVCVGQCMNWFEHTVLVFFPFPQPPRKVERSSVVSTLLKKLPSGINQGLFFVQRLHILCSWNKIFLRFQPIFYSLSANFLKFSPFFTDFSKLCSSKKSKKNVPWYKYTVMIWISA